MPFSDAFPDTTTPSVDEPLQSLFELATRLPSVNKIVTDGRVANIGFHLIEITHYANRIFS